MTTLLTPAYRLIVGKNVVDTTAEPKASATTDLTIRLDIEAWPDDAALTLGQVGGIDPTLKDIATVALGYADNGGFTEVFTGLVDALRTGLLARQVTLTSGARALARLRVDQTFEGQTAGAIVRDLAGRAKVDLATIEDGITFPVYVVDSRRTALAHVRELAALSGVDAYIGSDGKLVFQAFTTGQTIHELDFAKQVLSLEVERDVDPDVTVHAFGESPTGSAGADSWGWLTKDFSRSEGTAGSGARPIVLENPVLRTAAAAATAASARLRAIQRRAERGTVRVPGQPGVKLGDAVRLSGVPTAALNDTFQVRRVIHRITKDGGFTTTVGFAAIPAEALA
jgi:phage protein D